MLVVHIWLFRIIGSISVIGVIFQGQYEFAVTVFANNIQLKNWLPIFCSFNCQHKMVQCDDSNEQFF